VEHSIFLRLHCKSTTSQEHKKLILNRNKKADGTFWHAALKYNATEHIKPEVFQNAV